MKKSLVLAMAMALGVTASAYAANPFSDVPAGHWAYDSIAKLAAAGVVDGYPDGAFKGQNLMTRYEMAQIVAKAMAKGANVEALAAEFADELDNLGVRVAALEKKTDNVKITGAIRYHYASDRGDGKDHQNGLRSRIYLTGQVNDDWSYHAMWQNMRNFKTQADDKETNWKEAYMTGKLGGLKVTAGRYNSFLAQGYLWDARANGAELSYGDKIQITGFVGQGNEDNAFNNRYYAAEVSAQLGKKAKVYGGVAYFNLNPNTHKEDKDVWHIGAQYDFGTVALGATYLHGRHKLNNATDDKESGHGVVIGANYKGADFAQPGSWGLEARYYNQHKSTYIAHTIDGETFDRGFGPEGFCGWSLGASYTFAKNIMGNVTYYDTKSKTNDDRCRRLWSELQFVF